MPKSKETLPIQFYVQNNRLLGSGENVEDNFSNAAAWEIDESISDKLKAAYKSLWSVLVDFSSHSRKSYRAKWIPSMHMFETHEVPGHPGMFLRYELVNNEHLALLLEQKIQGADWAGMLIGAHGQAHKTLLRARHLRPTFKLNLIGSSCAFHPDNAALQTNFEEMRAMLSLTPMEAVQIQEWYEKTEDVITVPETSLRETTKWLDDLNKEISAERLASKELVALHNQEFRRLFASLANPRVGG